MPFGGNFHPEWGALAPAPSFVRTARIVAVATAIGATTGAGVVLSLAGSSGVLGPQTNAEAASDKPFVIVHSLVQPAEAAPIAGPLVPSPVVATAPVNVPAITPAPVNTAAMPAAASAPVSTPAAVSAMPASTGGQPPSGAFALPPTAAQVSTPVPSDSRTASTPAVPASVAALAEIPAATEASPVPAVDVATFTPDQTGAQKIGSKKPQAHPQAAAVTPQTPPKKRPEERGLGPLLRHLFSARAGSTSSN